MPFRFFVNWDISFYNENSQLGWELDLQWTAGYWEEKCQGDIEDYAADSYGQLQIVGYVMERQVTLALYEYTNQD